MNHRDIQQLSEYLDGRLSPSDSARLETRLASDPALASTLEALRESRSLLRRLPHRRAPRNFTLTPKMVGQKPPLTRAYPVFRFATVMATIIFSLSLLTSQIAPLAASAPATYGIGGGMGGGSGDGNATQAPMLEMIPAATQPPAINQSPTEMALLASTATPALTERVWAEGPAVPKSAATPAPFRLTPWQIGWGLAALLGALSMLLIQKFAARKWRTKN